jgi:SAM-dependent methyltransferase
MSRFSRLIWRVVVAWDGAARQLVFLPARFLSLRYGDNGRFHVRVRDLKAHLVDAVTYTPFDRHYVYHVAWALRVLRESEGITEHVDIASSLHFVTAASASMPVRFYDYRQADLQLTGLTSERADLMQLPFTTGSLSSISCMHVIEHVGLGRYGDEFDPCGDLKAVEELKRVVAPGGQLLFVIPISGDPRVEFNAHRVYGYDQVIGMFSGFDLEEFALIPDRAEDGGLLRHADPVLTQNQHYGCGCFHFRKVAA